MNPRAVVTGAGGFIGHHMVKFLKAHGYWVRGVDTEAPEFEESEPTSSSSRIFVSSTPAGSRRVRCEEVYQLAADMGGIGYITEFRADVARNNVLINAHMLEASRENQVSRYFFSSSACIYPMYRQESPDVTPLTEEDAMPAAPEEGYGWEKLYAEKLCQYYQEEGKLLTRVARFHNIYGPFGTYEGGREKAPAAICRKLALARDGDEVEVWGDGQQTRSFMYVDDCVEGIYRIMHSDHPYPLNLGEMTSSRLMTWWIWLPASRARPSASAMRWMLPKGCAVATAITPASERPWMGSRDPTGDRSRTNLPLDRVRTSEGWTTSLIERDNESVVTA